MATAEEKPESSDFEKDTPEMEGLFRDVAEILYHLSPEDLEKFRIFNHKFEKVAEKVYSRRECECLNTLKDLSGVGGPKGQGVIRKVISTAASLLHGTKKKEIEQLRICSCHVTQMNFSTDPVAVENPDPILNELANHCPNVETLNLNSCNVSVEGLSALKRMDHLRNLSLCFCEQMSEDVLHEVAKLKQLKKLKLCWNQNLPLQGIEQLVALTELERLDISHSNITDAELKYIAKMKGLISLNFEDCPGVTDKGIKFLRGMESLKTLNLSSCRLTDEGLLRVIEFFPNLTTLELRMNSFSDEVVCHLKRLEELRSLDLSWAQNLTGTFLDALSECPNLQILTLAHSHVMIPISKKWKNFQSLMILNMPYCRVNDDVLHEIALIPLLTNASFSYSDQVTLNGVKNLTTMPHLQFLDLIYCGLNEDEVRALFTRSIELRV